MNIVRHRATDRQRRAATAVTAVLGADFTESVLMPSTTRSHQDRFRTLRIAGSPTRRARIADATTLGDADGALNVLLTIELDGQFLAVSTIATPAEVPRIGQEIDVIVEPATGTPLYARETAAVGA